MGGLGGSGGFSGSLGSGCGAGGCGSPGSLAVNTRQSVRYIPIQSTGYAAPTNIAVESQSGPINFRYQTMSAPVNIQHVHVPSRGSFKQTQSTDEPHVRVHTVTKPIIQEVREIIAPQRIIRQQVQPVREEIQTLVLVIFDPKCILF